MSRSAAKNFPVTVTQLPVTRCVICQRTVAFRPGEASTALTKHYELRHKDKMGLAPAEDSELSVRRARPQRSFRTRRQESAGPGRACEIAG
jgi:hypothetical protein